MKTLFLGWQAPNPVRAWFPIGRLDAAPEESYYRFRYTGGAPNAERETGMTPLVAFVCLDANTARAYCMRLTRR